MKLTLTHISEGDEEVIVRYREMNEIVETIISVAEGKTQKISAVWEGSKILLRPEEVFYFENVDGTTYAYLKDKVVNVSQSLRELSFVYERRGFFRCSKSMVLNIYKIESLKSEPGNRIQATMENGERVIISRKYAKQFRQILKGGRAEDER